MEKQSRTIRVMGNPISRAPYPAQSHCAVCRRCTQLELWDDGLNSRFCAECFDLLLDAGELLVSQGLSYPGPEQESAGKNI
jgi:hypothetical protein